MARRLVSLLSIFLLSTDLKTGVHAFGVHTPAALRPRNHERTIQPGLLMTSSLERPIAPDDSRLRVEGIGAAERARLAESIAEEFRARTAGIVAACEAQLEQQRASHKLEMAQLTVDLLEDTLPLAAHDEVVSTIADDYSRRQAALRAQVQEREESLRRASSDVRGLSDNLTVLKRDVGSLRNALGRQDEDRRALAAKIRADEVEPQTRRANAAESDLSELRRAAHGWLAAGHALKLEAAAEARESGYASGYAAGRKTALSELLVRSHRERLALREETAAARAEAVEMVAAAGAAGAAALSKSRDAWRAEGRAEGVAAAAAAAAAVVEQGRLEKEGGAGERGADGVDGVSAIRETFAAYVVSAHEQKLAAVAAERAAAGETVRGLSDELARAHALLATLSKQESASNPVSSSDSPTSETAMPAASAAAAPETGAVTTEAEAVVKEAALPSSGLESDNLPLRVDSPAVPPWSGSAATAAAAAAAAAVAAASLATTSSFWQECSGGQ